MVMAKGLTSFSTCTSLDMAWQATRELINTFLAELRLTVSGTGPALFGVPSELHRGLEHLAPLPVPCGGKCPERVPFHFTCSQQIPGSPSPTWEPIPYLGAHSVPGSPFRTCKPIPYMGAHPIPGSPSPIWKPIPSVGAHPIRGSPAHGFCRLHSEFPKFLSVTGNICWIRGTGGFCVLSHWKWSGTQSWLQIAPGNNTEYIFASNISKGNHEILHMIGNGEVFLQRTLLPNEIKVYLHILL